MRFIYRKNRRKIVAIEDISVGQNDFRGDFVNSRVFRAREQFSVKIILYLRSLGIVAYRRDVVFVSRINRRNVGKS